MKEIIIDTQAKLDTLKEVPADTCAKVITSLKLSVTLPVYGKLVIEFGARIDTDWGRHVVAWESSHVEARESSHVEARGSSHVVAWESSHVVARGSSHVEAWGCVMLRVVGQYVTAQAASSVAVMLHDGAKCKGGKSLVAKVLNFFTHNGVKKTKVLTLYKRVSHDLKTQEGTANETLWAIGSTVTHKNYTPKNGECGAGKFHACPKPYFCDEFRTEPKDRYIALSVKLADAYAWPKNPQYPHKIGFREGVVLYECDRYGNKVIK